MNRYIEPLAVRRGFEFQIALDPVFVGRDENLADVAIPKPHRFLCSLRSCADNQRLGLIADKAYVQGFARPEDPRFGGAAGRASFPRPVAREVNGLRAVPNFVIELTNPPINPASALFLP